MISARSIFVLILLACAGLLGFGYYLQYVTGLEPCPLCILQRLAFFALLAVSLVAAIHAPGKLGIRVYAGLGLLATTIGGALAGRQVWLQHLPAEQVPECGPGLEYMLDVFPVFEALRMILAGSGECAEIDWMFLGLSIAQWSLGWFVLLGIACLYLLVTAGRFEPPFRLFK